jgi:hypothetical protein
MASILNVDQINNAAGTSGIALDASTGKASFPNSVIIPNGATMPAGSVLQVVQGQYSTTVTSSSTSYIATGLTASITPTSTSSKILVLVSHPSIDKRLSNTYLGLRLNRDGSVIAAFTNQDMFNAQTNVTSSNISYTYLDSPSSTSALTYSTVFNSGGGGAQVSINWNGGPSTLTLMEIAG